MTAPIPCRWTGEAMAPLSNFAKLADQAWVVGQLYHVEAREPASAKSRGHYFAALEAIWQSLPHDAAERFPSPDHLRKWALIKAGDREDRSIVCATKAEASRVAAFIRPLDGYAVITVREAVVTIYTAKSQSAKAMGKEAFQKSKEAVLAIAGDMVGLDPAQERAA